MDISLNILSMIKRYTSNERSFRPLFVDMRHVVIKCDLKKLITENLYFHFHFLNII